METITPTPELRARFEAAGGKPVYVRRMFGRIAGVYDFMNRLMSARPGSSLAPVHRAADRAWSWPVGPRYRHWHRRSCH